MSSIPLVPGMRYAIGVRMTDQQAMLMRQQLAAGRACVYPRGRAPFQPEPPSDHTHVVTYTETQSGQLNAGDLGPDVRWIIPYPTAYDAQQCASGALLAAGVNQGWGLSGQWNPLDDIFGGPSPAGTAFPTIAGMRYAVGVLPGHVEAMASFLADSFVCIYQRGKAPFPEPNAGAYSHVLTFTARGNGDVALQGTEWALPYPTSSEPPCASGGSPPPPGRSEWFGEEFHNGLIATVLIYAAVFGAVGGLVLKSIRR